MENEVTAPALTPEEREKLTEELVCSDATCYDMNCAALRALLASHRAADARIAELQHACSAQNEEVCQVLGKVLGYPWFKDDQENFPGATDEHGVCVGEHVAETIAAEAATRIVRDDARIAELEGALDIITRACEAGAYVGRTSPAVTQARAALAKEARP